MPSVSFAFKSQQWSYHEGLPTGCAIYCDKVSTPGVYGGSADVAYIQHIGAGAPTDGAVYPGNRGSAISWERATREFTEPADSYKDISRIHVTCRGDQIPNRVDVAIRINGGDTDSIVIPLPLGNDATTPRTVAVRPPVLANVGSYQIVLRGESSAPFSINEIDVDVVKKGRIL